MVYSLFLPGPKPVEKWTARGLKKKCWEKGWKPFMGSLTHTAKITAFANLASLFNFLVEMNYLEQNPFKSIRPAN